MSVETTAGSGPAQVQPSVNCWRLLGSAMQAVAMQVAETLDYSYTPPSFKDFRPPYVITPSLVGVELISGVLMDVHEEENVEDMLLALAVVGGRLRQLNCPKVPVFYGDRVHHNQHIARVLRIKLGVGGPPTLGEGISMMADCRPKANLLVILTDNSDPDADWGEIAYGASVVAGVLGDRPPAPKWIKTVHLYPEHDSGVVRTARIVR